MWIPGWTFDRVPNRTHSIRVGSSAGGSLGGMQRDIASLLAVSLTGFPNRKHSTGPKSLDSSIRENQCSTWNAVDPRQTPDRDSP